MKIALRVLLGYFLIVALAALLLVNVFLQQVKPGVRQAMEDTLADTANVLAELASDDMLAGRIADGRFAMRVRAMTGRELADELEVSLRTLYRDIAELMAQRVPVRGEAGTGSRRSSSSFCARLSCWNASWRESGVQASCGST